MFLASDMAELIHWSKVISNYDSDRNTRSLTSMWAFSVVIDHTGLLSVLHLANTLPYSCTTFVLIFIHFQSATELVRSHVD